MSSVIPLMTDTQGQPEVFKLQFTCKCAYSNMCIYKAGLGGGQEEHSPDF